MMSATLLLVLLTATPDGAVPVKEGPFVDVVMEWDRDVTPSTPGTEGVLKATIDYTESGRSAPSTLGLSAPFSRFDVIGKWWVLLGEFALNPGIIWRWKDDFTVQDAAGKTWRINRAALSKYPALLRRLRRAKPLIEKIEVRLHGHFKNGAREDLLFLISGNDFLIYPEDARPYMVATSPAKWSDRVLVPGVSTDKEYRKLWSQLTAVSFPRIVLHRLRIPEAELASIAREYERLEKEENDLAKKYPELADDYVPPGVKPWTGSSALGEPVETSMPEVRADQKSRTLSLVAKTGEVIRELPMSEVSSLTPVAESKVFIAKGQKPGLLNRRGEPIAIEGETSWGVEQKDGTFILTRTGNQVTSTKKIWMGMKISGKFHSSTSDAQREIDDAIEWRQRQSEKNAEGTVSLGYYGTYAVFEQQRVTLDASLKVLRSERGYVVGGAR